MTDLQLGLLILGVVAVIGVLGYNRIQERRAQRAARSAFESAHADVLLDSTPHAGNLQGERHEPTLEASAAHASRESSPHGGEFPLPEPRIDYVIELAAPQGMNQAELLVEVQRLHHRFSRRMSVAVSSDGVAWHAPSDASPAHPLAAIRIGLQLVSRDGMTSEADLIELRTAAEGLAGRIGAGVEAPEMRQAMETARALDRLCAETDIQVVIHVVPGDGDPPELESVRRVALDYGLHRRSATVFVQTNLDGDELFVLEAKPGAQHGQPVALAVSMDVPRVPELVRVYESMVRFAQHLASASGAVLADDNGNALNERALAAIEQQLRAVEQALTGHGIESGGPLARRVFS